MTNDDVALLASVLRGKYNRLYIDRPTNAGYSSYRLVYITQAGNHHTWDHYHHINNAIRDMNRVYRYASRVVKFWNE